MLGKLNWSWISGVYIDQAACTSPGNCVLDGSTPAQLYAKGPHTTIDYLTQVGFHVVETNGTFSAPIRYNLAAPNSSSIAMFSSVALGCVSTSECVDVGQVETIVPVLTQGHYQFQVTEYAEYAVDMNGAWSSVQPIAGVSGNLHVYGGGCSLTGGCTVAGGLATSAGHVPFVVTTS